jgi:hypothetical protein
MVILQQLGVFRGDKGGYRDRFWHTGIRNVLWTVIVR